MNNVVLCSAGSQVFKSIRLDEARWVPLPEPTYQIYSGNV